jgi:(1->4)-alpha-D-glucan 1-alpha-D-glucosylmutase
MLERHTPGSAVGRLLLHRLLERQHFRLAWWRSAPDEINWRRFFDVIDLAGLRVEEQAVFEAVHGTIFRLYEDGLIDGLRVDHIDGLADPRSYCRKLRQRLRKLASKRAQYSAPDTCYLVVEKILATGELLPVDWHTDGTTGYVFMDQVGALLHDPDGEAALRVVWTEFSGLSGDFAEEERRARQRVPEELLAADFNACAHSLHRLARRDPVTRDWTLGAVKRVLAQLLIHFPVYRTYVDARGRSPADAEIMISATSAAKLTCRPGEAPLVDVMDGWLGGTAPRLARHAAERRARLRAIGRFQQLTSPVAAKSVEDTAMYRHATLLSRNDVGANPNRFSISVAEFHAACAEREARYPAAMLATATHDHKRGEDLRARLAVLSEVPQRWAQTVLRWNQMNRPLKPTVDGVKGPDPTDEYMLYQMLVGAWPFELQRQDHAGLARLRQRLADWQQKAVREAKRRSEWIEPNRAYELACSTFVERLLDPASVAFLDELSAFVGSIAAAGALNGLVQTLLRLTTPGVPDLYQGCEWWDLSLVDPDNRQAVDFSARATALDAGATLQDLIEHWQDGHIKQRVIREVLAHRALRPQLFAAGSYLPLQIAGPMTRHLIAYARLLGTEALVVLAPRFPTKLLRQVNGIALAPEQLLGTRVALPDGLTAARLTDLFSRQRLNGEGSYVEAADALRDLPIAVLTTTSPKA